MSQAQGVILLHFSLPSTQLLPLRIQAKNTVLASFKSTFNVCLRLSVVSKKIDVEVLARYLLQTSKFLDRKVTVPVLLYMYQVRYGTVCVGTLCAVLRIRVVYPESEFFHPGSRVERIPDPSQTWIFFHPGSG